MTELSKHLAEAATETAISEEELLLVAQALHASMKIQPGGNYVDSFDARKPILLDGNFSLRKLARAALLALKHRRS